MGSNGERLAWTRGVTRRFGRFVAVDRVDLDLHAGEVVGLLGANGAGKTTLIRMLLGLLGPTGGEVALFGEPPSRSTRRRLGYVPQTLGLYEDLTATENLEFARAAFGQKRTCPRQPKSTAATKSPPHRAAGWGQVEGRHDGYFGGKFGEAPVGQMSWGMQRRVAFAAALDHRPDLLVLDEPTSGVAPLARARLWETIHAAADRGVGVLVTTHHMEEAAECDRLVVMEAGRVVATGTVSEIVGDATVLTVESEAWAEAFAAIERAGLAAALVGRSLRLPEADRQQVEDALRDVPAQVDEAPATLEERFFQLTGRAR